MADHGPDGDCFPDEIADQCALVRLARVILGTSP